MGLPLVIAGMALSGIGQAIKNRQAQNDAAARVAARNKVLADTMAQNRPLADSSRALFDARIANPIADETAPSLRGELLSAVGDVTAPDPVASSAPESIRSEIAGQMAKAVAAGRDEAARSAKVGAYGDAWFGEGVANNRLSSELGQNANFAGGNLALLPHLQDLAEVGAVKRHGPIADIFTGMGSILGAAGGAIGPRAAAAPVPLPRPNPTRVF